MLGLLWRLALPLEASPDEKLFDICLGSESGDAGQTSKSPSVRVASCCARYPDSRACSKLGAFCKLVKGKLDISLCAKYFRHLKMPAAPAPPVAYPAAGVPRRVDVASCVFYGVVWVNVMHSPKFGDHKTIVAVVAFLVGAGLAWMLQMVWVCVTVMEMTLEAGGPVDWLLCLCGMALQWFLGRFRLFSAIAGLLIGPSMGAYGGVACRRRLLRSIKPTGDILGILALKKKISERFRGSHFDELARDSGAAAGILVGVVAALIWHSLNEIVIAATGFGFFAVAVAAARSQK